MPYRVNDRNGQIEEYSGSWESVPYERSYSRYGRLDRAIQYQHITRTRNRVPFPFPPDSFLSTPEVPTEVLNSQTEVSNVPVPIPISNSQYGDTWDVPSSAKTSVAKIVTDKINVTSEGNFQIKFDMVMPSFGTMINQKMVEDAFKSQAKVYLTSAIAEMIKTPEFAEMIKPKIKEHLLSLPLGELLGMTGGDMSDLVALFDN